MCGTYSLLCYQNASISLTRPGHQWRWLLLVATWHIYKRNMLRWFNSIKYKWPVSCCWRKTLCLLMPTSLACLLVRQRWWKRVDGSGTVKTASVFFLPFNWRYLVQQINSSHWPWVSGRSARSLCPLRSNMLERCVLITVHTKPVVASIDQ